MLPSQSSRKLVWVTGQSGCGKTTLGQQLHERRDFVHFDGDVFASGGSPETFSGIPTAEMLSSIDETIKTTYAECVANGFGPLLKGEPCPPLEVWKPFHDLLCNDIERVWNDVKYRDKNLVVSFAVYPRMLRRYLQQRFPNVIIIALNDTCGRSVDRKFAQVQQAAAAANQSIKEFLQKFGPEWSDQTLSDEVVAKNLRAKMQETQTGYEPANAEEGEFGIDVGPKTGAEDVFREACKILGLQGEKQ